MVGLTVSIRPGGRRPDSALGQTRPDHQMVGMQVHVAECHLRGAKFAQTMLQADDVLSPIEVAVHHDSFRIGTRQFVEVGKIIGMLQRARYGYPQNQHRRQRARPFCDGGALQEAKQSESRQNRQGSEDGQNMAQTDVHVACHPRQQDARRERHRHPVGQCPRLPHHTANPKPTAASHASGSSPPAAPERKPATSPCCGLPMK